MRVPSSGEGISMRSNLLFGRIVDEFVRWRAVAEDDRSPAPAWWWGPAFENLGERQPMPPEWCAGLELPAGASYADGAAVFVGSLAGQTSLPWPEDFPRRAKHADAASTATLI
jgi:hypothetical protein